MAEAGATGNVASVKLTPGRRIFAHRLKAFTILELLVVLTISGLVTFILLAALTGARPKAQRIHCVGHLKNIGLANRIFATDNGDLFPWERQLAAATNLQNFPELSRLAPNEQVLQIFRSLSNELSTPKILACPADGRKAAENWRDLTTNNISYFLGTSAQETYPQSIMAGDRNITTNGQRVYGGLQIISATQIQNAGWDGTMHKFQGSAVMGDGSVQQLSLARLRDQLKYTGLETNTFIFP